MCSGAKVSRASLTDLKMGRKQSLSSETLIKIAKYFNVTTDYLLTGEKKEKLPTNPLGPDEQLDDVAFALYGKVKNLSDAQKRDVLRFVEFIEAKDE